MSDHRNDDFLTVCRKFDQAMLVTQAPDHSLQARPMFVAELEDNGDLWFATDFDSGKVSEIQAHPEVCVTMSGGSDYAAISGVAEIVQDRRKVEELWNELWKVWFPDGVDDPRLVLLKVNAREGEYWSHSGTNRLKYLFESTKAYLQGERPRVDQSQHGHVNL